MNFAYIVLLLCEGLILLFAFFLLWTYFFKTPYYPSSTKALQKLVDEGYIKLPKGSHFIDIGSGDGRFVFWASKKGLTSHGIEFNPFLTLISRIRLLFSPNRANAKIFNKDFGNHNYKDYDMVYLYLYGENMDKIREKLFRELKKGALIVSNTFTFSNIKPDKVVGKFYIYQVK